MTDRTEPITTLITKAAKAAEPAAAMQLSQAALNAANALATLDTMQAGALTEQQWNALLQLVHRDVPEPLTIIEALIDTLYEGPDHELAD